jgi:hypothetical protein
MQILRGLLSLGVEIIDVVTAICNVGYKYVCTDGLVFRSWNWKNCPAILKLSIKNKFLSNIKTKKKEDI